MSVDSIRMLRGRDVARRLGIGTKKLHTLRKAGRLNAMRYDGRGPWMFFSDSVARFLGVTEPREISDAEVRQREADAVRRWKNGRVVANAGR
jgi:hypothetical protein